MVRGLLCRYGFVVCVCYFYALSAEPDSMKYTAEEVKLQGTMMLALGFIFLIPFAIAPFLPKVPWVWVYGIVMIAIGMTSLCCLPATIPLLIFWIKPEARQYFGRE